MSGPVIIRLENLPLEARTLDIRRFFEGLSIPDGGVHIIGGERGLAFIAFNSDEDARQAMSRDVQLLCNAHIKLYLSSKTEMQNIVSAARNIQAPIPQQQQQHQQQQQQTKQPIIYTNTAPVQHHHQQHQQQQQPDLLSSLTKLISTPSQANSSAAANTSNLLDQLKNIFPTQQQQTSPNAAYKQQQQQATSLPPALADIFNKTGSLPNTTSPQQQQQQYYDPNKAAAQYYQTQQQQQQPVVAAPTQPAAAAIPAGLSQVNLSQLLNLLSSTLNQQATPAAVATQPVQQAPQQQLYVAAPAVQQQQLYQQQQQPVYQTAVQAATTTSSSAPSSTYNKYYQAAPSYKQDQTSSNRSSNEYKSSSSYSGNTGSGGGGGSSRYDYDSSSSNNYRNGGSNKRYNDGQYTDNFNSDRRYSRDDDSRPRGGGGGGGGAPRSNQLDPIIRVRNFNPNCSYKDIRTFLQGIQIEHDGIKLITDSSGNRTGMAYVRLCTIIDLKKALCRNGQYCDTRSIEVVQSTQHEFGSIDNYYQKSKSSGYGSYQSKPHRQDDYYNDRNDDDRGDNADEGYHAAAPAHQDRSPTSGDHQRYSNNNGDETTGYYLKIFGLPTRFDRQSLQNEFNNVKFMRIQTIFKHDLGRPMLIVEVETKLDLERALTRHNERVARQKIQVEEMTRAEFEEELNLYYTNRRNKERNGQGGPADYNRRRNFDDDSNGGGEDEEEDSVVSPPEDQDPNEICVSITGVPFSARNADVKYFFQDMNLLKINLLEDPQTQRSTGECCCMFKTKEDRDRALSEKDDQLFRNRVVKIKPITYAEYQDLIVNRKKSTGKRYNNNGNGRPLLQTPMNADEKPKLNNEDGGNSNDYNDDGENGDNNEDGGGYDNDRGDDDYDDGGESNGGGGGGNNYGNGRGRGGYNDYKNRRGNYNSHRGGGNYGNGGGFKRRQSPHDYNSNDMKRSRPAAASTELPPLPPELEGIQNLVLLTNVSHKATREDILDMLRQYNANEQTLKIRQYDNGKPTGEAIVAFNTRDDLDSFLQQMNGNQFLGRALRITEVSR